MKHSVFRFLYKVALPFRRLYWFIARPETCGAKCIIIHNKKVLMIRNTYGHKRWNFPGGGKKKYETFEQAAIREAYEEVGVQIKNPHFLFEYYQALEYKHDSVQCFYAFSETDTFKIDQLEILEAKWFSLTEIPENRARSVNKIMEVLKQKVQM